MYALHAAPLAGVLLVGLLLPGCGGVRPVVGGTEGILRAGGEPLSDVQVTLHQAEGTSFRAVGFAISDGEGKFRLVTNEAKGPLELAPGDYRCTLESAGAPVEISGEYLQPATSPVKVTWSAGDQRLKIEVPSRFPER